MKLAILVVACISMSVFTCSTPALTTPSARMAKAFTKRCEGLTAKNTDPESMVIRVLKATDAKFSISIEQCEWVKLDFKHYEIHPGTLKRQLDEVAETAGMKWQANGDWLNFYPKSTHNDPKYVMNKRIPGKVVVSPNTSQKEWFRKNHISCVRVFMGMRKDTKVDYEKVRYNYKELQNPTLRELYNAHMEIYEIDGYQLFIRQTPDPGDPDTTWTVIEEDPGRIWKANMIFPKEIEGMPQTPAAPAQK